MTHMYTGTLKVSTRVTWIKLAVYRGTESTPYTSSVFYYSATSAIRGCILVQLGKLHSSSFSGERTSFV